jgi:hypothetical protein
MLTGIYEIDQAQLMNLYKFSITNGTNLLTFGPAGIGKTEMAMQACKAMGYKFKYLNLSMLEAPDLMGLPRIDDRSNKAIYALPDGFPLRSDGGEESILLVDEIDKAKPELQNPMLELFQFRSINGVALNFRAVLATGNLPDENAFSQPVSHALTNRCSVYRVRHAFEPWRDWAVKARINPLIVGFLSKNQDFLLKKPAEGDDTAYAHPSPRAWALASKDLDAVEGNNTSFKEMLVAGRCGIGAAVKFKVWIEYYHIVEPLIEDLLKTGKKPSRELEIDKQIICAIAGCNAMLETYRDSTKTQKERERVTKIVCEWLIGLPPDHAIAASKSTLSKEEAIQYKLYDNKYFMALTEKVIAQFKKE